MSLALEEDVHSAWCLGGLTWRCTPYEAMGIWSTILFYTCVAVTTLIHLIMKRDQKDGVIESPQHHHNSRRGTNNTYDDDLKFLSGLLVYFFTFTAGCLVWVLGGNHLIHPIQSCPIQLVGSAMLLVCSVLFISVHTALGTNWSPVSNQLQEHHQLVTTGIYQFARHPMYALFLWATLGTLLATLNLVIAWCVTGAAGVMLQRIKKEEYFLIQRFGQQYVEYQTSVSALGPPWGWCLGFDNNGEVMATRVPRSQYHSIS